MLSWKYNCTAGAAAAAVVRITAAALTAAALTAAVVRITAAALTEACTHSTLMTLTVCAGIAYHCTLYKSSRAEYTYAPLV
eukprot:19970-Heterococcus_DN1.PRE.2